MVGLNSCGLRRLGVVGPAFTLVELLIVVMLVAIASALVVPMTADTDATRVQSAARLVMADLGFAQVESITHASDPCLVTFDSSAGSYTVAHVSAPGTPITNPSTNQTYFTQFGIGRASEMSGVTIQSYALGGDNKLGFGAYGQTDQATAATITLQSGTVSLTITVDPTTGETTVQ